MQATIENRLWVGVEVGRRSNEESPKPSRWEKRLFGGNVRIANLAQAKGMPRRTEAPGEQERFLGIIFILQSLSQVPALPRTDSQQRREEEAFLAHLDFVVGSLRASSYTRKLREIFLHTCIEGATVLE